MDFESYAFISYQTNQKETAGRLKELIEPLGIKSFLAHEDIHVSEEWRLKILEEISKTNIFIPLLSTDYFSSTWCVQESGIAAYSNTMTIIPLSLDGTIPQGFISHIQSSKIDPATFNISDLIPGLLKVDFTKGIAYLIEKLRESKSFRGAEANFRELLPYLPRINDGSMKKLFEVIIENNQIHHASFCAHSYIPQLIKSHGHLMDKEQKEFLDEICEQYK